MKHYPAKTLFSWILLASVLTPQCLSKPGGDYSTLGDYGAAEIVGQPLIPETPAVITTDLKPASTYGISYGAPHEPIVPIIPFGKLGLAGYGGVGGLGSLGGYGGFGGLGGLGGGWGWKSPQPVIAPIPIITKQVPIPITIPLGWGWQSPGIF